MFFVYLLTSTKNPDIFNVSWTQCLERCLKEHNSGQCAHTQEDGPWTLTTYVAFNEAQKAIDFEHYLKTGSGRSFAKRHLYYLSK